MENAQNALVNRVLSVWLTLQPQLRPITRVFEFQIPHFPSYTLLQPLLLQPGKKHTLSVPCTRETVQQWLILLNKFFYSVPQFSPTDVVQACNTSLSRADHHVFWHARSVGTCKTSVAWCFAVTPNLQKP